MTTGFYLVLVCIQSGASYLVHPPLDGLYHHHAHLTTNYRQHTYIHAARTNRWPAPGLVASRAKRSEGGLTACSPKNHLPSYYNRRPQGCHLQPLAPQAELSPVCLRVARVVLIAVVVAVLAVPTSRILPKGVVLATVDPTVSQDATTTAVIHARAPWSAGASSCPLW